MTSMRIGSLATRIMAFYLANPEEELSIDDITVKFGMPKRTVEKTLQSLRTGGLLESAHVVRLAGKGSAAWKPPPCSRCADAAPQALPATAG